MNLLKSYKEKKSIPNRNVFPNFNLDDKTLLSYVFGKTIDLLDSSKNQNYKKVFFRVFNERNVKIVPEKYMSYAKKIEETYNADGKKNPIEDVVKSEFMQNFASLFGFSELETYFFVLLLLNSKEKWLFGGTSDCDIPKNANILSRLSGFTGEECAELLENHRKNALLDGKGLIFEPDGELKLIVSEYFYNADFYEKCCPIEITYDLHRDFYSLQNLATSNSEDFDVVSSLLKPCFDTRKAVFISAYGQEAERLKNFLPYALEKEKFKTVILEFDGIDKCEEKLFLFLAFSAQLYKDYAFIVHGYTICNLIQGNHNVVNPFETVNFLENYVAPDDECTSSSKNAQNKTEDFSVLDLVQTPVFILENPFVEEKVVFTSTGSYETEEVLPLPNFKEPKDFSNFCSYNWQVKVPSKNEYTNQFVEFMMERGIESSRAEKVCETCKTLRVLPSEWQKIFEVINSLKMLSEENLSKVIESKFCTVESESNLRKNNHYNLDVLNTSIPVQEVIESIKNAEKWQESEYDFDSGLRILLYGISGAGKTAFVEHIAEELDKPLISIKASDYMRGKAGDSEKLIKQIFEEATKTNSILFIDEADSILRERTKLGQNWEVGLVNEFIQHMERFPGIIFCSTNLSEFLDRATNRRFHIQIEFKKLEEKGVKTLCDSYFGKYHFSESQVQKIYSAGDVCPGDFGAVYGNLRFTNPETLSAAYISEKLIQTVKAKNKDKRESIGFAR